MTHINAYEQDVQDKELAVDEAKAQLEQAQSALESHPDYVAPKKQSKGEKVEVKVHKKK